jgi:peptide deformylase|tara:strand:- start:36 stop:548 length:513 start_codon:yes stop_codon:yes gene_type:complete
MELQLITHPNDILHTPITEEWDMENPQYDAMELRQSMWEVMTANSGQGLSANQVGLSVRVFVFLNTGDSNADRQKVLAINPSYTVHEESVDIDMFEGCLSYPGVVANITRPNKIRTTWTDHKGKLSHFTLDGMAARCFLHEMDHLDGLTMDEHVSPRVWKEAMAKAGHVS